MSSESTIRNQMAVNKGLMDVEKAGNKVGDKRKLKQAANELAELLFVESHAALRRIIANNSQGVRNEHVYLGRTHGYKEIAMYCIPSDDWSGLRPYNSESYLGIDGKLYKHDWVERSTWSVLDPMAVYKDAMHSYEFFDSSMDFAMHCFRCATREVKTLRTIYPDSRVIDKPKARWYSKVLAQQSISRVSTRVHEVRGPADLLALEALRDGDIVRVIGQDLLVPLNVVGDGTVYVHVVGSGNTITHGTTDHVQFAPFQADFTLEVL